MILKELENRKKKVFPDKPFLICIALVLCIEIALNIIFNHTVKSLLFIIFLRFFEIIIIISIFKLSNTTLSHIGLSKNNLFTGFKKGIIWSIWFGIITIVSFSTLYIFLKNPINLFELKLPYHTSDIVLFFIAGGIIGPIAEELFFRGIIFGYLRQFGFVSAIIISTVLFTIIHKNPGFIQFTGGFLFALSYEKEKSILTPITIHILGNLSLFLWGQVCS